MSGPRVGHITPYGLWVHLLVFVCRILAATTVSMICLPIDTFHDRFNAGDNSPFGTHRHCGWRPIFCRKYTIYVRAIALRVSLSNCPQYPHERHCRPGHLVDVRFFLHITISIYAESRLNHNKQQKENCDHSARIVHRNKNAPISCRAQRTGTTHTQRAREENIDLHFGIVCAVHRTS